jgi:hypothetical protein
MICMSKWAQSDSTQTNHFYLIVLTYSNKSFLSDCAHLLKQIISIWLCSLTQANHFYLIVLTYSSKSFLSDCAHLLKQIISIWLCSLTQTDHFYLFVLTYSNKSFLSVCCEHNQIEMICLSKWAQSDRNDLFE